MHRLFYVACATLVLFVLYFATLALPESPKVWYDEGYHLEVARVQALHGFFGLQVAPREFASAAQVTVGFPLLYPVALSYEFFGVGVLEARAVMVLFIFGLLGGAAYFLYKLFGAYEALFGSMLLATSPLLYGNGKSVLGEVPGLFYLLLFFILLLVLERREWYPLRYYAAAGFVAGLTVATKPIFILLIPAVAIALLLHLRHIPIRWSGFAIAVGTGIVPLLIWVMTQFSGDSLSAVFMHYSNPYQIESLSSIVVTNFLRFFTEATPLYCAALLVPWVVFVTLRLYRKEAISFVEWVALMFVVLVLLAYLRTAGWYRYLFPAYVLLTLFAAPSLFSLARALPRYSRAASRGVYVLLLALGLFQAYELNTTSFVAQYYHSSNNEELSRYFSSLDTKSIFLYNVPELSVHLSHENFYQYLTPLEGREIGSYAPLVQGVPYFVVATEESLHEHPERFAHYSKVDSIGSYHVLRSVSAE